MADAKSAINLAEVQRRLEKIPIFHTLPFKVAAAEPGMIELKLPYKKEYDGIFNSLHGGFLMTLAGSDALITTTDMNIRFLGPCRSEATARAKVIKFGKSLVPVEVNLYDADGKHVAVSQVTYMRLRQ